MRINYSTTADAHLASHRYRVLIPANIIAGRGHEVAFNSEERADVGIFNKHFNYDDADKARQMWRFGGVVFDICDNHFNTKHRGHYERMIGLSDLVVCGTEQMAEVVGAETGAEAVVIPDPYELPEEGARYEGGDRLLWFGHPSNLQPLLNSINRGEMEGYCLQAITASNPWLPAVPWSFDAMLKGLRECDLVVLPVERNARNDCKGANRMVEAIRMGRFVVAGDLPAYRQFKDWMFIGNLKEGLLWAKQNRTEIPDRIRAAQEYVRKTFDPEQITDQWESALTSVAGVSRLQATSA